MDWSQRASGVFEDESGAFTLSGLTPGKWRVSASAEEFLDAANVDVELSDERPITLMLRRAATIRGVVVDASGAPVQGAHVSVEPLSHWISMPWLFAIHLPAPAWLTSSHLTQVTVFGLAVKE